MKKKVGRKKLTPGMTTSYKTPVIKGDNSFYDWLNSYEKYGYKSINQLITEALKLKYMMDNLKMELSFDNVNVKKKPIQHVDNKEIKEVEMIDISDIDDFDVLENTFASVKR
ncbi:hypothetical protein F8154_05830 [Alkaliphilus pronyensis]|uniref:Uncharacterized protein n=1 Tax=Alkaliphilus pronyensis TaxID=1482732 RepID=A0A6I0FD04_9FIRM|nr:hypothetical protein [Alkaliphilus pronyensis]KAB3535650.1 hypothetical protein F8154_05830 [Alkaliphilus pronyensis]